MTQQARIRLARRHAGMSQMTLAAAVQVQRSAVSHWESAQSKNPSVSHLRDIALATGVQFEWLVTGRGAMTLGPETRMDSVPTAEALLVEIVEQLASQRTGRIREAAPVPRPVRVRGEPVLG